MKKTIDKSQAAKSKNGNSFEKDTLALIRKDKDKFNISKLVAKKRYFYKEKQLSEIIAEEIAKDPKNLTLSDEKLKKKISTLTKKCIKNNTEVLRTNKKFYKEADISFMTNGKYFYDGSLSKIRFIIDTTTSARTDRIKGKAQDSSVYKDLNLKYVYLIVLPDDKAFNDYKNPKMERKMCENAVFDANFRNIYKEENVSLIIRQKDIKPLLSEVAKNEGKDINKVIEKWKNKYYSKMKSRIAVEDRENAQLIADEVFKILRK